MTELEQFKEYLSNITWELETNNSKEPHEILYDKILDRYSVSLKNSYSSAGDNSIEQTITDEGLVSKIEDMLGQIKRRERMQSFMVNTRDEAELIIKAFNTHRSTDLRQTNIEMGQSIANGGLMAKIEDILRELLDDKTSSDFCSCYEGDIRYIFDEEIEEIKKDFSCRLRKAFNTHRSTDSKPSNARIDNLINDEELEAKIKATMANLEVETSRDKLLGIIHWELVNRDSTEKELIKLFRAYRSGSN